MARPMRAHTSMYRMASATALPLPRSRTWLSCESLHSRHPIWRQDLMHGRKASFILAKTQPSTALPCNFILYAKADRGGELVRRNKLQESEVDIAQKGDQALAKSGCLPWVTVLRHPPVAMAPKQDVIDGAQRMHWEAADCCLSQRAARVGAPRAA